MWKRAVHEAARGIIIRPPQEQAVLARKLSNTGAFGGEIKK